MRFKARPTLSLVSFSGAVGLAFLSGMSIVGSINLLNPVLLLVTYFMLTYGTVKNLPDYSGDKKAGTRTTATVFRSMGSAVRFSGILLFTPYLLLTAMIATGLLAPIYLADLGMAAILAMIVANMMKAKSSQELEKTHTIGFFYAISFLLFTLVLASPTLVSIIVLLSAYLWTLLAEEDQLNNALAAKEFSFDILKGLILSPVSAGFNLAVMGPPGVGKSTLCQELIKEAFTAGLKCLYVITNNPIPLARDQLREMGVAPVARTEPVIFVDMYSWLLGERSPERFQIDNASDVAGLSVVLSTAAETAGDKSFVTFDTLSTLLAYNTEELTVRFMKSHLARMKRHGNIGVYPIETGIHSNSFYNEVKATFDGVLELKLDEMDGELRRFIRVYRYRGSHETKWFRLLIGPNRDIKIY